MQISIRELKSHLSKYIHQAQAGQAIEVTSHRQVVARIVGVPKLSDKGLADLVISGAATWSGGKPTGASLKLKPTGKSISDLVLEDRN